MLFFLNKNERINIILNVGIKNNIDYLRDTIYKINNSYK